MSANYFKNIDTFIKTNKKETTAPLVQGNFYMAKIPNILFSIIEYFTLLFSILNYLQV